MNKILIGILAIAISATGAFAEIQQGKTEAWKIIVEKALKTSTTQGEGKASVFRQCHPEEGKCITAIYFANNGYVMAVAMLYDASETVINRFICKFNGTIDIMDCIDFDTNISGKWMKNSKTGNFEQVR